jgi:hypothetical protein
VHAAVELKISECDFTLNPLRVANSGN